MDKRILSVDLRSSDLARHIRQVARDAWLAGMTVGRVRVVTSGSGAHSSAEADRLRTEVERIAGEEWTGLEAQFRGTLANDRSYDSRAGSWADVRRV